MSNAKRDDNYNPSALAADTDGNPAPLKIDPTTGRLLIEFSAVSESSPIQNSAKRDENRESVAQVWDGTNIKPLLMDNRNGYLFVDILWE